MTQPCASLAQLVEQLTLNQWVGGSNPPRCTTSSAACQEYLGPDFRQAAFFWLNHRETFHSNPEFPRSAIRSFVMLKEYD